MTPPAPALRPLLLVLAATLLWSTAGVLIKATTVSAWTVSCTRSAIAALVVAALSFRDGFRMTATSHLAALLYAILLMCFVLAAKYTTAANAIFLQYTAPLHVLLLGPFILREPFRARDLGVVLVCLGGMSLLFLDTDAGAADPLPHRTLGNIFALVSGLCLGLYFLLLKHPRAQTPNPSATVVYGNLYVVVLTGPFVLSDPPTAFTTGDIWAIAALGAFQIGLAYWLFTHGMRLGARPSDAAIMGFIEPVLNPIWVFLFLGEQPTSMALLGGAIILTAVGTHTALARRRQVLARAQANPQG
jgi:DME family drug/metabolite transporter